VSVRCIVRGFGITHCGRSENAAHLITLGGKVVVSPFFDAQQTADAAYASTDPEAINMPPPDVWDVVPFVSSSAWQSLSDASSGAKVLELSNGTETYIIARSFIPVFPGDTPLSGMSAGNYSPQYVVLVAARKEKALESISKMQVQITSSVGAIMGIAIACVVLAFLVAGFVTTRLSWSITKPLTTMMRISEAVTQAASDGRTEFAAKEAGLQELEGGEDEVGDFVNAFLGMVRGLNQQSVSAARIEERFTDNPFYVSSDCPDPSQEFPWQRTLRLSGVDFLESAEAAQSLLNPQSSDATSSISTT
jgi:hypothetical protein